MNNEYADARAAGAIDGATCAAFYLIVQAVDGLSAAWDFQRERLASNGAEVSALIGDGAEFQAYLDAWIKAFGEVIAA